MHANVEQCKNTAVCLQEKAETDWLAETKQVDLERLNIVSDSSWS